MGHIHISRILYAIMGMVAYLYFALSISNGNQLVFDQKISHLIGAGESIRFLLEGLTLLGSTKGFIFIAILVLLWLALRKKDFSATGVYLLALASGYLVNSLLKEWHNRPRPVSEHLVEVNTLSFPSGNAMIGLILYALTAYFIIKDFNTVKGKIAVIAVVLIIIFLYGVSRIALNVHYPSDVAAGYALGLVWTIGWIYLYEALERRKRTVKKQKLAN